MTPTSRIVVTTLYGPEPVSVVWQRGGLAVHKSLVGVGETARHYTITHVRSGFRVEAYLDKDQAVSLGEALLPCGDWTQDFFATMHDTSLLNAARAILNKFGVEQWSDRAWATMRRKQLAKFAP